MISSAQYIQFVATTKTALDALDKAAAILKDGVPPEVLRGGDLTGKVKRAFETNYAGVTGARASVKGVHDECARRAPLMKAYEDALGYHNNVTVPNHTARIQQHNDNVARKVPSTDPGPYPNPPQSPFND